MRLRILALLVMASLGSAPALLAQGVLIGTVRHDSSGTPLSGVEVLLNGTSFRTETNAQGRYMLTGLPAGIHMVIFRHVGYLPARVDVRLSTGDTTRANAMLIESAVELNPVVVTGTPSTTRGVGIGREAFEERRRMGFGIHFDSAFVRRNEHRRLEDVLVGQMGVAVSPRLRDGGRYILSGRRRAMDGGYNCYMQIYLDGMPLGRGGVAGASDVRPVSTAMFPLSSLEKFEVFRSAAEVPMEYGGASAGCGVVLLWSRRGP